MEWPLYPLEDLTDPKRPITYGVVKPGPEDPDNGVKFIRGGDIFEGKLAIDGLRTITPEISKTYSRTLLSGGELVVSLVGNPGHVAVVPKSLAGANLARQAGLVALRSEIDADFVKYFLMSPRGRAELFSQMTGSVQVVINLANLRTVKVPTPPLPIQRRIASILSAYDELIENSQRRIKILEAMARALYREWFVRFRFPGHESVPRVSSPLGEIPQGWRVGRLGTICETITSGGTPRTSANEYWGGSIPWLSSGETGNAFITETDKTITEEGVANSSTRLARAGCTVVASAGQGKTRGQTSMLCLDCYINQSTIALTADTKITSNNFLFLDLSGRYSQLRQISDGSSRGSLTTRLLSDLEVVIPSTSLVHEFDDLVAPLFKYIEIGVRRTKNLRRTRDLLLPRLLSGLIDVEAMPL